MADTGRARGRQGSLEGHDRSAGRTPHTAGTRQSARSREGGFAAHRGVGSGLHAPRESR